MKYSLILTALLGGALAAPMVSTAAAASEPTTEGARVIVRFKAAAPSVRAKIMSAREDSASAQDIAQTRATGLGLRTGVNKGVVRLNARRSLDERTHVFTAKGIASADLVKRLAQDSEVEMVVIDHRRRHTAVTPNDPLYVGFGGVAPGAGVDGSANGQWYLKAPSSVPGEVVSSINAPGAWDRTTGISSVVVAVLDTGVRFDHPDIRDQFIAVSDPKFPSGFVGYDMITSAAIAGDGGSRDGDASDPGDFVSQADIDGGSLDSDCANEGVSRSSWHGTRVAGLVAASSDNGQGIAGVAWGVKILPVRVLGKCGGYDSDIMAGMRWAVGLDVPGVTVTNPNVAKVLNLSLGGTASCSTDAANNPSESQRITAALYRETINAVIDAGATVVAAAGNGVEPIGSLPGGGVNVGLPANCPGVIAVAALRHVGTKVGFSNLGSEVAIAAPGGNCVNLSGPCLYTMLSTTNSGATTPVSSDGAYTNNSSSQVGTSFSAPIVSGTVALMLSVKPSLTPSEVLGILKSTARSFIPKDAAAGILDCKAGSVAAPQLECYCTTSTCGAGMLDAAAAVAAADAARAQTISFEGPTNKVLGSGNVALVATASSGLSVSFSSSTPSVCTVSASSASLLAVGTCTVTATQAGNESFAAASPVIRSFSVEAAPVAPPAAVESGGGGGGGGAFSGLWVLMLGFSTWLLRRPRGSAC